MKENDIPAYHCIFSPKTLDLARHGYNLYNNRSKNPAEPLFLSNPAKRNENQNYSHHISLTEKNQVQ
jgi:hypothetical protein